MSTLIRSSTETAVRLRAVIEAAKAPIALKALAKQVRLPAAELQPLLTAELQGQQIHRWPDQRGQQRFWHSPPDAFWRERILTLASQCAMPATALAKQVRKHMPPYPVKLISSAIQQLLREKQLQKYKLLGREELLGRSGYPGALAAAGEAAIAAIREKVAAVVGASKHNVTPDMESAILDAIAHIQPSRTAPVSARELRAALPHASKTDFDEAARNLRRQRRAYLSRHDFPQSLPPADLATLIDGQDGSFYVAITARDE